MKEKLFYIELTYLIYWSGFLCLTLTMFRFKLKTFALHIAISTLLLSNISTLVQMTQLVYLMAVIQLLSSFICMWLIFKVPMKHTFLMILISLLICMTLEWVETALIPQMFVQFITEENMVRFFSTGSLFALSLWLIAIILRIKRIGFTFIPQSNQQRALQFTGSKTLKIGLFISLFVLFLSSVTYFIFPKGLITLSLVVSISIALLLRISYHWEVSE